MFTLSCKNFGCWKILLCSFKDSALTSWQHSSMYGDSSDSFSGGSRDPFCKCAKIFKQSLESQSLWNQDLRSWSKIEPPVEPTCSAVLGRPPPSSTRDCRRGHWTRTGSMLRHWDNVKNWPWQEVNWLTNVANDAAKSGGYSAVSRDRNVPSGQQCSNGPWGHEGRILPEWKLQGGSKRNTKLSPSQHQIDKHVRVPQKGLLHPYPFGSRLYRLKPRGTG